MILLWWDCILFASKNATVWWITDIEMIGLKQRKCDVCQPSIFACKKSGLLYTFEDK